MDIVINNTKRITISNLSPFFHHCCNFQLTKRSLYAIVSCSLLFLLAYNSSTVFYIQVPVPANSSPEISSFLTENVARKSRKLVSLSSSTKRSSSIIYAVKEEPPRQKTNTQLTISRKNPNFVSFTYNSMAYNPRRRREKKSLVKVLGSGARINEFSLRMKEFFGAKSYNNSCKYRFFMTWISSIESFGEREQFAIESLFKAHSNGCLVIMSTSMDSPKGMKILKPFFEKGLKVTAVSPDFNYLFKHTIAQGWIDSLMEGNIDPGEVSIGQNLSNLLRLGLLYKFGGIYLDTDVIVLRSFGKLRNVIGAQTIDVETRNWSRLNNAVMIFDKGHPLLYKFIEEFALTFDGNKWGHNGPYLVSRVVSRVSGRDGYNFTVLPPLAFYPVDWSRIGSLFLGPRNETHSKWLLSKLRQIQSQSLAVHLWNKQSRGLKVEEGSIIQHIMSDCCVFCNSYAAKFCP
ncbi:PREDICTED: uncharacterized protein At4g19900 [Nicotiana attenuata]|uniref:uncharacterized protein At4g19900 n=1 Tax=Nicotiana attenuata TaxID=49451 RepID=UPI000904F06B|nr:PREDICTED: uncharacterized protein At4g19900 [Nicotiana attenuata]